MPYLSIRISKINYYGGSHEYNRVCWQDYDPITSIQDLPLEADTRSAGRYIPLLL
jgi:hypothetical protein